MPWLGLMAIAAVGAPAVTDAPTPDTQPGLVSQALAFLHASDNVDKARLARTLRQHDPWALRTALGQALRRTPAFARQARPGVTVDSFDARRWRGTVEVAACLPREFDPSRAYPVLVGVPWTNGTARAAMAYWQRVSGDHADRFLIACPSQNVKGGYHASGPERMLPLEVLDWLSRRVLVDHNRVFLAGYSKGGHAAWDTGLLHGDRFAGMIPLAGSGSHELGVYVAMDYLDNTPHVPLFAVWGEKDEGIARKCRRKVEHLRKSGREPVGIELPGVGHGKVQPPTADLVGWLDTRRRDPHPTRLRKWFHRLVQGHCFWVEVAALVGREYDPHGKVRITLRRPASKARVKEMVRRKLVHSLVRVRASVEHNHVTITTRRVGRMHLYIDPDVVDARKPLTVTLNGRQRFRGTPKPSSDTVLGCADRWRDPDRLYVARITLTSR